MSTHANNEFKEHSALWYEWGMAAGLAGLILFLELVPPGEMGRISTRTSDSEMEAVEADLAFDDTVEEQQEEVQQQQEEMQQAAQEMMEQLQTDVTISLSTDTIGLSSVSTVSQTVENVGTQEMGPPRFMPVEVFPNCTFKPAPTYPEMARMAGVEGTVTLWVFVKPDGTVGDVQLYNSSGVTSLDDAALDAARRTRWVPAQNNGIAVGVWTTLQYVFTLTG